MSDITELKRALAMRAQSVAEYLLPAGKKEAHEWRAGSASGEPGKSLGVHLAGNKAGLWADFNTGEGGDLIDLWCETRGKKLIEALDEIRSWLGVERPKAFHEPKRTYVRPPKPSCVKPAGRVLDYLTEDRNIKREVIELYRVAERGDEIVFPFLLPSGELAMAKARKAADGAKPVPTARDCEPVLFGWQAVPDDARSCVLTEGEIDALSWASFGHVALSVPFGGGGGAKQQWIENDFERMQRFEKIYIATDMDGPGEEAAVEIAQRLGRHRCYRVKMPHKDGNSCLVAGVEKAVMDACITDAEGLDPDGLRHASHFTDAVMRLFYPGENEHTGYCMPYHSVRDKLQFRPGEVTLWSGAAGSGKSQLISDCTVDWVHQGSTVCVASLEMSGKYQMKRMMKQCIGVDRPTEEFIHKAMRWLDGSERGGLLVYERVGKAGIEALLEVFTYARARYGADQFVIDSLMRLGIDGDDYTGQERIMFQIVDWVITNNVHLHLVAHSRKGSREQGGTPETEDVKGAMEIGANAFNIVTIFRNRQLERQLEACEDDEERKELEATPPVLLNVCKQRNGDYEGVTGLWFNTQTYRYKSSKCFKTGRNYIPYGGNVVSIGSNAGV